MIAAICKARLKIHGLLPAQAKGLLQFQAHTDVFIADLVQL
jgi:hypothetical protein